MTQTPRNGSNLPETHDLYATKLPGGKLKYSLAPIGQGNVNFNATRKSVMICYLKNPLVDEVVKFDNNRIQAIFKTGRTKYIL
jgi:hypothetical protein